MRALETADGIDPAIAALAGHQCGVVSRDQLVALGLARGQIQRRVAGGRLLRLHPGVYAVGHRAPRQEARWLAAVLACGEGAVLSHRSAGALWQIIDRERPDAEVTVRARRRTPGVTVHRGRLAPTDRAICRRIPVTSPARTLTDLAHDLDDDLVRALREAQFRRLLHPSSVPEALTRRRSTALRTLLEEDAVPTQSILEDRLLAICDRYQIPRPLTQQHLAGRRVDFLWPAERVVVETDGWAGHSTPTAFQADRATANALQLAGYTILRFTHLDVTHRSRRAAGEIRAALDPVKPSSPDC
jgi:very-short-patch-repair endonuclease